MPNETEFKLQCRKCGGEYSLENLLAAATDYWEHVEVVMSEMPCCGVRVELQLATGRLLLGRVYVAGAPQFRVEERHEVPIQVRTKQDELLVKLKEREFRIHAKART